MSRVIHPVILIKPKNPLTVILSFFFPSLFQSILKIDRNINLRDLPGIRFDSADVTASGEKKEQRYEMCRKYFGSYIQPLFLSSSVVGRCSRVLIDSFDSGFAFKKTNKFYYDGCSETGQAALIYITVKLPRTKLAAAR